MPPFMQNFPTSLCLALTDDALAVDLFYVLAAAAIVSLIAYKLRIAAIPAYILAGILIGPSILGLIPDADRVSGINAVALILLMFGVGLSIDLNAFRGSLRSVVLIGTASTVIPIVGLFIPGILMGLDWASALVVSMALTISSTAVVMRVLQTQRRLRTVVGRLSLGVMITQDLLGIVILALLPAIAAASGITSGDPDQQRSMSAVIAKGAMAVGGIAGLIVVGRLVLPRLFSAVASTRSNELLIILSAAFAIGAAGLTKYLGFSPELGAFMAGFLLAATPFRFQVAALLGPMRDLFMAVFFAGIGVGLAIGDLGGVWLAVVIAVPLTLVIKAATMGFSAWAGGASPRVAGKLGIYLSQAGEFSLIILGAASLLSLLDPSVFTAAVAVVVITIALTPSLMNAAPRIAARLPENAKPPWIRGRAIFVDQPGDEPTRAAAKPTKTGNAILDPSDPENAGTSESSEPPPPPRRVIIAGFGPVGRSIEEQLAKRDIPVTIIELNPGTVRRQQSLNRTIIFGDASHPDVLDSAGLIDAAALVLTMPDDEAMLRACKAARTLSPSVFISARAGYLSTSHQAMQAGADHVVVEEMATAQSMAAQVTRELDQRNRHASNNADNDNASPDTPDQSPDQAMPV